MSMPKNQAEVDAQFARLEVALANVPLKREAGHKEIAKADEFMLMQFGAQGEVQFKHRETRNYVFLFPSGRLFVPETTEPFTRGTF
jgi:hypothetical protein